MREEIIAPLLRRLGYRSGTANNILRELTLRYPKKPLGHKKETDPVLRGKADYVLEVEGPIRWVIEAKPPSEDFTLDAIEQAYSYASHPEVRAVLFAICNGRLLRVFQTSLGPDTKSIFELRCDEFDASFSVLDRLLSPAAIRGAFPKLVIDARPPLGPGLRSVARILHGAIRYKAANLPSKALLQLQTHITGGSIQRDESGQIIAYVESMAPLRLLQQMTERLGMNKFEMFSIDSSLSTQRSNPTQFMYKRQFTFPANEELLNLETWETQVLPVDLNFKALVLIDGVLEGTHFEGNFRLAMDCFEIPSQIFRCDGDFEIYLA